MTVLYIAKNLLSQHTTHVVIPRLDRGTQVHAKIPPRDISTGGIKQFSTTGYFLEQHLSYMKTPQCRVTHQCFSLFPWSFTELDIFGTNIEFTIFLSRHNISKKFLEYTGTEKVSIGGVLFNPFRNIYVPNYLSMFIFIAI